MEDKGLQIILNWQLQDYLESHDKVIVIFYSDTCNKCHFRMNNLIDLAIEWWDNSDPFVVAYDAGNDSELCDRLWLTSVPMLIAFENWEELWRIDEVQTNDFIKDYFKRNEWEWDNLSMRAEDKQEEESDTF